MRTICFFICIAWLGALSAQTLPKLNGDELIKPAINESVGISCGFAGTPTEVVTRVKKLYKSNASEELRALLFSLNNSEAFLASLVLRDLMFLEAELNTQEQERLNAIMNGEISFYTCNGCLCCESTNALELSERALTNLKHFSSR